MKNTFYILLMLVNNYSFSQVLKISTPIRFLALGDSYTKGESVETSLNWPNQLYKALNQKGYPTESIKIIAQTGWRTDDLQRAIDNANLVNEYNLVSLLIGVNNQYQGKSFEIYQPDFEALLTRAIELAGGKKENVFVVSIPDYAYTPFGAQNPAISLAIDLYNAKNKSIANSYNIAYFDITPISRRGIDEPSLVASDGLHPSALMYTEWVNLMMEHIEKNNSISSISVSNNIKIVEIHPNPSSHLFKLKVEAKLINSKYQILNLQGEVMYEDFFKNQEVELNTKSYKKGSYFLKIDNYSDTFKLIIE